MSNFNSGWEPGGRIGGLRERVTRPVHHGISRIYSGNYNLFHDQSVNNDRGFYLPANPMRWPYRSFFLVFVIGYYLLSLSLPPLSISSLFYLSYHILIQDENEEAGSADYEEADLSNLASLASTQVTIICFMIYLYNYCICICDRGPTFPPSQCGAPLPRSLCFSEKDIYLYLWSGSYLPAKSMRRPSTQITF